MNKMIRIQKRKVMRQRKRSIMDVILRALPEDPGCVVVVDARFLLKHDRANTPAGAGTGAGATEQANANANAHALKAKTVESIVAFFAARGIRHVIVVPEAAAGDDSDVLKSGPSVQPSNRVGDSIIALIEQEDKSTSTGADDLHVIKSNSLVVVSAHPCLMKRAVRAGAKIMLPRALMRMVRGADTTPPAALTPVLLGKDANATTKTAFAASVSAEAALMSDQDADDAEDDLRSGCRRHRL